MSKWKAPEVEIVQIIFSENSFIHVLGLGDDGRVYRWIVAGGAWEKYWSEEDKPVEG